MADFYALPRACSPSGRRHPGAAYTESIPNFDSKTVQLVFWNRYKRGLYDQMEGGLTKKLSPIKYEYASLLKSVSELLDSARRASARSVNAIMSLTYWQIGRSIVEHEQAGKKRAKYGQELIKQLSVDLNSRFGRGFSERNLRSMRAFYLQWPIQQTVSAKSAQANPDSFISPENQIWQTPSAISNLPFPLPWSHYVKLLSVEKQEARDFYEQEAIRGGWSERQLGRQINSQFFERTLLY